jgi:hypothetical protein
MTSDGESIAAMAEAALRQAARKLVQEARRTGTTLVVWKDGRVQEIPGDLLEIDPEMESEAKDERGQPSP